TLGEQTTVDRHDLRQESILGGEKPDLLLLREPASLLDQLPDLGTSPQCRSAPCEMEPDLKVAQILELEPAQRVSIVAIGAALSALVEQRGVPRVGRYQRAIGNAEEELQQC